MHPPSVAPGANRHHALFTALLGCACLGATAIFANNWLQREWLRGKWLYRTPSGLIWLGVYAAVAIAAFGWIAVAWRRGRWGSRSLAPLRWILPFALGAWVAVWTIEPPTLEYDAQLALAGAAAAWSACLALRARALDRPWPRWARVLDVGLFEIAICAFTAEAALRVVRVAIAPPLLATSSTDVDAWIRAHRLAPGSYHLGFPINAAGFVDSEPNGFDGRDGRGSRGPLVACLGDSFSVGVVPHHLHYTTVAEGSFDGLEVYNIGVVNAGPREYLRMLETDALPLQPDLIVIALFVGNDIQDAHRHDSATLSAWMDRDEILILQLPRRLWALARERSAAAAIAGAGRPDETFGVPGTLALSPGEIERRLPWLADPLQEPAAISAARFEYVEASRVDITLPERRSEYGEALAYLERMRAKAGSIPIACVLIPDEFQVEDALWERLRAHGRPERAERELPQRIVGAWLDERRVPYVDLLPLLRAAPPLKDGGRHVFHLRDTHFNARGNRIAGAALAGLIERCGIAKRARAAADPAPR